MVCRGKDADQATSPSVQFPSADDRQFLYSDGMQRRGSQDRTYLHRRHSRCAQPLMRSSKACPRVCSSFLVIKLDWEITCQPAVFLTLC